VTEMGIAIQQIATEIATSPHDTTLAMARTMTTTGIAANKGTPHFGEARMTSGSDLNDLNTPVSPPRGAESGRFGKRTDRQAGRGRSVLLHRRLGIEPAAADTPMCGDQVARSVDLFGHHDTVVTPGRERTLESRQNTGVPGEH
jgi:hypothetical protein